MFSVKDIQTELIKQGYNPGLADGILGRRTIHAIEAYQIQHALKVDGIAGINTLSSLFRRAVLDSPRSLETPWLEIALSKKGLQEDKDNAALKKFLVSDGGTVGDPSVLPWCGDFVETCIALSLKNEILPANPYLARNWSKFGQEVEATLGAIGVFWRGDKKGISGHVAFLVGKGNGIFYILGGNQSNKVSITSISTSRLLNIRWPLTASLPRTFGLPEMKGGKLSLNEE